MEHDALKRREKTLLAAMLLSAWAPVVTFVGVLMSGSLTQIGDFVRRTAEFVALAAAYVSFRRIRTLELSLKQKETVEKRVSLVVSVTLGLSGLALLSVGIPNLIRPSVTPGDVRLGLVVAILGFVVNMFFLIRYTMFEKSATDVIIRSQKRLYMAKAVVDSVVVFSYVVIMSSASARFSSRVDGLGMVMVAIYLVIRAFKADALEADVASE
jgi:Co/Zn/Cd efflux system component